MTLHQATEKVLRDSGEALHCQEITRRVLDGGLWHTGGTTPNNTVIAPPATAQGPDPQRTTRNLVESGEPEDEV